MFIGKKFLFVVGLLFCLSFVSAGVTIEPNKIVLGGSTEITIDLDNYDTYVYFYSSDLEANFFNLGCEGDLCKGKKTFEYTFSSVSFPIGEYEFWVKDNDVLEWSITDFEIVGEELTCTDSDVTEEYPDGINYFVKGIVHREDSMSSSNYYDICWNNGEVLHEWYCDNTENVMKEEYTCPYGCEDGVCVEEIVEGECTDSDVTEEFPGGKNYYVKGTASGCNGPLGCELGYDVIEVIDFCVDNNILWESSCEGPGVIWSIYECPNGCLDGACVGEPESELFCEEETSYYSCSEEKPKYCENGNLINNCQECGCAPGYECSEKGSCVEISFPSIALNKKLESLYKDKEVFLISDLDWKDVLPFVSVTTWTGKQDCQGGYGTAENICIYPTLIYHREGENFDADSIIYFMQQYNPSKVTIIGETPQELDDLLIAERNFGAGFSQEDLQRRSSDDYLSYWESFNKIVYVEDNYELALLASIYASLINAPLIIQGSAFDSEKVFEGRKIICVGSVSSMGASCNEQYNLEQLQTKYKTETNTDKIILVNPDDWEKESGFIFPEKSSSVLDIFSKTSLVAPILASAKHELILSYKLNPSLTDGYIEVDNFIEPHLSGMNYLTVMADFETIPHETYSHTAFGSQISWALDQHFYADTDGDFESDVAVGRIAGFTVSDVSSYVARDLFYDTFQKTNNMKFMASSFRGALKIYTDFFLLIDSLKLSKYNIASSTVVEEAVNFNPVEWENQDLIYYTDHGSSQWSGILSKEIPELKNSLIASASCSTVAGKNSYAFWANAIRKGAIGYAGAVSTTYLSSNYYPFVRNVYKKNYPTMGDAFKDADSSKPNVLMTTLIGDPTISLTSTCESKEVSCSNDEDCASCGAIDLICNVLDTKVKGNLFKCNVNNKCVKKLFREEIEKCEKGCSEAGGAHCITEEEPVCEGTSTSCGYDQSSGGCSDCTTLAPLSPKCNIFGNLKQRHFKCQNDLCTQKSVREVIKCEYGCKGLSSILFFAGEDSKPHCMTEKEGTSCEGTETSCEYNFETSSCSDCTTEDPMGLSCKKDNVIGWKAECNSNTCGIKVPFLVTLPGVGDLLFGNINKEIIEECENGCSEEPWGAHCMSDFESRICLSIDTNCAWNSYDNRCTDCTAKSSERLSCNVLKTKVKGINYKCEYKCEEKLFKEVIEDCEFGCSDEGGAHCMTFEESCKVDGEGCILDGACCSDEGCKMFTCGAQQVGKGCIVNDDCVGDANCVLWKCKTCLGAGTEVNVFTQGQCCNGWEWVTKSVHRSPKCWLGKGSGCGRLSHDSGYKTVNDYKVCK